MIWNFNILKQNIIRFTHNLNHQKFTVFLHFLPLFGSWIVQLLLGSRAKILAVQHRELDCFFLAFLLSIRGSPKVFILLKELQNFHLRREKILSDYINYNLLCFCFVFFFQKIMSPAREKTMILQFGLACNYSISGFAPDVVSDLRKMLIILFR